MPRPPVLPTINWRDLYERGKDYASWIASCEHAENRERMEQAKGRLALETDVESRLKAVSRPVHVIAIAEDWCGDVVRHVPPLQRLAEACPALRVRFIARETSPEAFARYLTNGGEAIPKFIFLSDTFVECGHWGPMPEACKDIIARGKACGDVPVARVRVSEMYKADKGKRIVIDELLRLINIASCTGPDCV